MTERLTIQAISSVQPDAPQDLVHIECATDDQPAQLDVHSGALSTLMLGLRQAAQAFPRNSDDFSGQPLELTGVGLVTLEDGTVLLELVLDGSFRVVIDVPDRALPPLHECLFAMGELRSELVADQASSTQH